jgi:hypothetical protein
MKFKFLLNLSIILCFSIGQFNTQGSSSVFDLVETDDHKGHQTSVG